jgi:hypothetical protein
VSLDFIGGIFQANAQDKATEQNAKNVADTNRMNLLLSVMSRGQPLSQAEADALGVPELAGKSSAILPNYLSDIEKATGTNAGKLALALQKNAPTVGDYTQILAPYLAQAGQARNLAGQVLSGDMTRQMLSEAQPVEAGRLEVASVQKNAALEALDKTLNEIDAIQARKGYSGDSFGNRLLKFNARAGIMSGSAANTAAAKLANAQQEESIKNTGRQLQLSDLTLPETLAAGEIGMKTAPTTAAAGAFNASMLPLADFNIGNHAFQEQNLPIVDKTSQTGLALSGLTSGGNSALNYGLNKYFQNLNNNSGNNGNLNNGFGDNPNDFNGFSDTAAGAGEGAGSSINDPGAVSAPAFG